MQALQPLKADIARLEPKESFFLRRKCQDPGGDKRFWRESEGRDWLAETLGIDTGPGDRASGPWLLGSIDCPPEEEAASPVRRRCWKGCSLCAAPSHRGTVCRRTSPETHSASGGGVSYETNLFPDLEYTLNNLLTHSVVERSLLQDVIFYLHVKSCRLHLFQQLRIPFAEVSDVDRLPAPRFTRRASGEGRRIFTSVRQESGEPFCRSRMNSVLRAGIAGSRSSTGESPDNRTSYSYPGRPRPFVDCHSKLCGNRS